MRLNLPSPASVVQFSVSSDWCISQLPCHFCGLAGIMPTMGRVPRTGHIYPFEGLLDSAQQIGPIARPVDDLALLLPILSGPDGVDPAIVPTRSGSLAARGASTHVKSPPPFAPR